MRHANGMLLSRLPVFFEGHPTRSSIYYHNPFSDRRWSEFAKLSVLLKSRTNRRLAKSKSQRTILVLLCGNSEGRLHRSFYCIYGDDCTLPMHK